MELKGSKTEANLMTAFAGESQARNKYTYYASKARKEGYVQIAEIFEETAEQREGARQDLVQAAARRRDARPPPPICWTRPTAKTTSGRTCTPPLPRRPRRRALTKIAALFEVRRQHRKGARGAVQKAAFQGARAAPCLVSDDDRHLAVRQLRPHRRRQESAGNLPRVRASEGILPHQSRKLLILLPCCVFAAEETALVRHFPRISAKAADIERPDREEAERKRPADYRRSAQKNLFRGLY